MLSERERHEQHLATVLENSSFAINSLKATVASKDEEIQRLQEHLGNVLSWLQGLEGNYRCKAITHAVEFYNAACPTKKVDLDSAPIWKPCARTGREK